MSDAKTEKKIAVYEAFINLIRTGKSYHNIKVSEIAEEAGIGKGTVYEYFDSRDTLITETVAYYLGLYLEHALELINSEKSFEKRMMLLYRYIYEESGENLGMMDILFSKGWISDIYSALKGPDSLHDFIDAIDRYCRMILNDAEAEGSIARVTDVDYAINTMKSSVVGFIFSSNIAGAECDEACSFAIKALIKALN